MKFKKKNKVKLSVLERTGLVKALPVGVFVYKLKAPDHLLLEDGNPKAEQLTGVTIKEYRGRRFLEIWPKARLADIKKELLKVLKSGNEFETDEIDYRDKQIKGPFRIKAFRITKNLLGVAFDNIAKLKSTELKLRQINEKIEIQSWGLEKANEGIKILYKELENKTHQLEKSYKKLKNLSLKDPHTGFYNHRYLEEVIEAEFFRAKRNNTPLSLIMIDIDYFKSINDVYGHKFGDFVLSQFAKQLKKMVRRYDIVIRYGGEEFLILSPGSNRPRSLILAQRILDEINLYNFGRSKDRIKMTLSLSVVSFPEDSVSKAIGLVQLADKILNTIKEQGGNRVYCSLDIEKKAKVEFIKQNGYGESISQLRERIEKLNKKTNQSVVESIFAFAKTIELKDHYTGEHVEMSVHYATEIARALQLDEDEVLTVRQAAILHDLGKIGISDKILRKPAKLNKKEFDTIKKHPQIGVDIIRPIYLLHDIIPLILYHHERWDGKGYPNGLKADEIPIGARIIALADVYQALTSERSYRKSFSKKEAYQIIKEESGKQFDPRVVSVFLKIIKP